MNFSVPDIAGMHTEDYRQIETPKSSMFHALSESERMFINACSQLIKDNDSFAVEILDKIIDKDPKFRDAKFLRAAFYLKYLAFDKAAKLLIPLTEGEYFVGLRLLSVMPSFRLHMIAEPMFWIPILPRTEEILIALALINRYKSDEENCYRIIRRASTLYPSHIGVKVMFASMEIEHSKPENVINLLSNKLINRQDDLAMLFRFFRGLALFKNNDHRSGFFQMESALDFTGYGSEYLKQNIRYRIIEECVGQRYYLDALKHLELLSIDHATIIPPDFDPVDYTNQIRSKIRGLKERGLEQKLSVLDKESQKTADDKYWEVDPR